MQLFADTNIDEAIKELEIAIPLVGLQNCLERHIAQHKPRSGLRRRMELLRALQIAQEHAA